MLNIKQKHELLKYLSGFITDKRRILFEKILENRTRYITVVLEDIFQPHNASAVLRSCDCFGIQDVYIIENKNKYNINPEITLGSEKWLNLVKFNENENNSITAINILKAKGYRIVATTPHFYNSLLYNFDLNKGKTALFFGNEPDGLSEIILKNSDEYLYIPMFGFTRSFNISVSVAIILYQLTYKLHSSNINWKLTQEEKIEILLNWIRKTLKRGDLLEKAQILK